MKRTCDLARAIGRGSRDPDEELALRARWDRGAQAEFYVRHRDAVFRYLRARCRDGDIALDLTATCFEKALPGLARYEPRGAGVRVWLLRIARNVAADHDRRRRPLVTFWPMDTDQRSHEPGPEDIAVSRDEAARLRRRLRDLPEIQRDALALRYGAGLTAREIAPVIGKQEEATQKLISRALARLKEAYRAEDRA
jgi:RNA polymerase sigma-70 factor, ECF subfamily